MIRSLCKRKLHAAFPDERKANVEGSELLDCEGEKISLDKF